MIDSKDGTKRCEECEEEGNRVESNVPLFLLRECMSKRITKGQKTCLPPHSMITSFRLVGDAARCLYTISTEWMNGGVPVKSS